MEGIEDSGAPHAGSSAPWVISWLHQFYGLSVKSLLVMGRRPLMSFLSMLIPGLLVFAVYGIQQAVEGIGKYDSILSSKLDLPTECPEYLGESCALVAWGPSNSAAVRDLMANVRGERDAQAFPGFETQYSMALEFFQRPGFAMMGVWFDDAVEGLEFSIWYNGTLLAYSADSEAHFDIDPLWFSSGIPATPLALQKSIEEAILKRDVSASARLDWTLESFEVVFDEQEAVAASFLSEGTLFVIGSVAPPMVVLGVVFFSLVFMNRIVQEKRQNLVAFLRMLGLYDGAFWWSCLALVASLIATGFGVGLDIFLWKHGGFGLHFGALFLYILASTASACMFAAIVTKTKWVNFINFIFLTLSSITSFVLSLAVSDLSTAFLPEAFGTFPAVFFSFQPAIVYTAILKEISIYASNFEDFPGIYTTRQWSPSVTLPTVSWFLGIQVAQIIFYMALAWYLGQIFTSDAGAARRFWFPFSASFWGCAKSAQTHSVVAGDTIAQVQQESLRDQSIRLHKISKTFDTVQAVKEVTLELKRGEITTLLGHNGAGKSTVINMITGLVEPTHGAGFVCGLDATVEPEQVQSLVGSCPQQDTLWDDLTAEEHLRLVCRFHVGRGMTMGEMEQVIGDRLGRWKLDSSSMMTSGPTSSVALFCCAFF